MRNLRLLKFFHLCGDPVACYRESQVKTMKSHDCIIKCRRNHHGQERLILILMVLLFIPCTLAIAQNTNKSFGEQYTITNLVSNIIGQTANGDSSLINPWGIARPTTEGPWWVADNGKGRVTVYSGKTGISFPGLSPLNVAIPATPSNINYNSAPTGVVFNGTDDFQLAPEVPSRFIFVTSDGAIAGWNYTINRHNAVIVADKSPDAAYTGVTIGSISGVNVLYAANFRQRRVDIFGPSFSQRFLNPNAFVDPLIPDSFSPYNVQNINGRIFVVFAKTNAEGTKAEIGTGSGYVDEFDEDGNLIMRLMEGPWMNAPWGITQAPMDFGDYGGFLLLGNSGSGQIAAFDAESGVFVGYLKNRQGTALVIPELHALSFGNNGLAGPATTLYFSAGGINIFGFISIGPTPEETYPFAGTYILH